MAMRSGTSERGELTVAQKRVLRRALMLGKVYRGNAHERTFLTMQRKGLLAPVDPGDAGGVAGYWAPTPGVRVAYLLGRKRLKRRPP